MTVIAENGLARQAGQWTVPAEPDEAQRILVVNLMPTKEATEEQFLSLLAATGINCRVTFAYPATHRFRYGQAQAIQRSYLTITEACRHHYDGLIVTGAPVEHLPFVAVDYWQEFARLVAWSKTGVRRAIFECWACQAALKVRYGLDKRLLPAKRFGIYPAQAQVATSPFLTGLAAGGVIRMPQSRHSQTVLPTNLPANLQVLARATDGEALLLASRDQHDLFITGHPEYAAATLATEYQRDRQQGKPIQPPINYYRNGRIVNSWQPTSIQLYRNWLTAKKGN